MPTTKIFSNRKVSEGEISLTEAFRQSEASVRLEGIDPAADPEYLALKARVLAGEITVEEAGDLLIAQNTQTQTTAA
jgi:hypothetical protein